VADTAGGLLGWSSRRAATAAISSQVVAATIIVCPHIVEKQIESCRTLFSREI
jgi:hypothetical protein